MTRLSVFGAILSGTLLALAFPNFDISPAPVAFVALVPLLFAIREKSAWAAFKLGYLAGLVFFGIALYWFTTLSYWAGGIGFLAYVGIVIYLSVYWGIFCFLGVLLQRRTGNSGWLFMPAIWVVLELLQEKLFSGFGWCLIGYTMSMDRPLRQWAAWGGVFMVSFIVVMTNALIYTAASNFTKGAKRFFVPVGATIVWFLVVYLIGAWQLPAEQAQAESVDQPAKEEQTALSSATETLRVSVIQPSVTLELKWNPENRTSLMRLYENLISRISSKNRPDLIVLPEAALPGFLMEEEDFRNGAIAMARNQRVFLMTGALHKMPKTTVETDPQEKLDPMVENKPGKLPDAGVDRTNAAFLFDRRGRIVGRYDKVHLAPFGEYIPWIVRRILPFVQGLAPVGDLVPGREQSIIAMNKDVNIGTLICFETAFPELSRNLCKNGANLLVAMTNLAWFGTSCAPRQELAISVFRAVENRTWLVRSANIGVSGFIDPWGNVVARVGQVRRIGGRDYVIHDIYYRGVATRSIDVKRRVTLYQKWGDAFVYICAGWVVLVCILIKGKANYPTTEGYRIYKDEGDEG